MKSSHFSWHRTSNSVLYRRLVLTDEMDRRSQLIGKAEGDVEMAAPRPA